jgi:hypothetical protein
VQPTFEPQSKGSQHCPSAPLKGATRRNHGEYFTRHLDPWLGIPHFSCGHPDDPAKPNGTKNLTVLESLNFSPKDLSWVFAPIIAAFSLMCSSTAKRLLSVLSYLLWLVDRPKTEYLSRFLLQPSHLYLGSIFNRTGMLLCSNF